MHSMIRPVDHALSNADMAQDLMVAQVFPLRHFADPSRVRHVEQRIRVGSHWLSPTQAVAYLDRLHREELTLDQPC